MTPDHFRRGVATDLPIRFAIMKSHEGFNIDLKRMKCLPEIGSIVACYRYGRSMRLVEFDCTWGNPDEHYELLHD